MKQNNFCAFEEPGYAYNQTVGFRFEFHNGFYRRLGYLDDRDRVMRGSYGSSWSHGLRKIVIRWKQPGLFNQILCARVVLTIVALSLAGCAAVAPVVGVRDSDLATSSIGASSRSKKCLVSSGHVLVLTSGGADGAFGAGALASWTSSGRRPRFDTVSGVSTGALQAPLAFLGSGYDPLLQHFFTESQTDDIFAWNGLSALYGAGLYGSAPLKKALISILNEDVLDKIAEEHAKGRRLFVTTTDLTYGRSHVWDMGAIASSYDEGRQARFISILLASVAVPGLIEPVLIEKAGAGKPEAHGDGGVKTPVPLNTFMLTGCARKHFVTVIVNGHLSPVAATMLDTEAPLPLAKRAISLLLRRLMFVSVEQARVIAEKQKASFLVVSLPVTSPEAQDPFDFKPAEMKSLFAAGVNLDQRVWLRSEAQRP